MFNAPSQDPAEPTYQPATFTLPDGTRVLLAVWLRDGENVGPVSISYKDPGDTTWSAPIYPE